MHRAVGFSAFWSKSTLRVLWVESKRSSRALATNIIFRPTSSSPQLSEIKRLCYPLCTTPLSTRATHNLSAQSMDFVSLFLFLQSLICQSLSFHICLSCLFHFFIWVHLLCHLGHWLDWQFIRSLSVWTKQAFAYLSSTGPVGEVLFHCAKLDLKAGRSGQAAFILFRLFSVIKGYCTFLAFNCQ